MPTVVGIRFKDSGKTYFFDPRDLELYVGDQIIVETVRGPELAKVAYARHDVPESELVSELKPVLRRAEQADLDRLILLQQRHTEVLERCAEKIAQHGLPMKLVKAEYSFDGSRLTFFFTSEKRVDFRLLVRDLARAFKSRIELRQIGPRDEAKLLGGIGPCGRLLCCATFLPDYARVSIKMAKDQDLPLNPSKISGVCGRLLCCLSYEHDQYLQIKATLPNKGAWVQTPEGPGEVVSVNVLKETVIVAIPGLQVPVECTPEQIRETTAKVGEVARSRVEAGITPVKPPESRRKDRGERRLLRDELESGDVLDALALLEESDVTSEKSHAPRHGADDPQRQRSDSGHTRRPPAKDARAGHNATHHTAPSGHRPQPFRDDDQPSERHDPTAGDTAAAKGQRPARDDDRGRGQGPLRRGGFELERGKGPVGPPLVPPPGGGSEGRHAAPRDDQGRPRRRHKIRSDRGEDQR